MERQRIIILSIFCLTLLGLGGWLIYSAIEQNKNKFQAGSPPLVLKQSIPKNTINLPKMRPPAIRGTDFLLYGNTTSSASIILFGNYDCTDCKTLEKTIQKTVPKYRGLIRYVWRDLPEENNRKQMNAAVFAACAGAQGKFRQAHEALLEAPALDEFVFANISTILKLDEKALSNCRLDPMAESSIWSDANAAGGMGVTSTPILFVGTEATKDILTEEELDKKIKQFLGS